MKKWFSGYRERHPKFVSLFEDICQSLILFVLFLLTAILGSLCGLKLAFDYFGVSF